MEFQNAACVVRSLRRPGMLTVASPFPVLPGIVRVLEPHAGASVSFLRQLWQGEFTGPFILDTGGMRHLYFDMRAVQSSMRLDEPDALVTAYVRKMMSFLLFNRAPRRILMIGLGGGSLVKFCHRHLPDTHMTVVELDPDIVALRGWFHIPPDDERLSVILGDGAEFVLSSNWSADVLLIDAFDCGGVAPSFASTEVYAAAFRRLGRRGLLVMNFAGDQDRYAAHLERLQKVCPGTILLVPVRSDGNLLIFAFAYPFDASVLQSLEATAVQLKSKFALEFPEFLQRLRAAQPL